MAALPLHDAAAPGDPNAPVTADATGSPGLPAPGQVTGADIAGLSQYELVALPSRAEPIERWRAQRYFCPADFNRDDVIDDTDTAAFLDAFASRTGPFAEFLDVNRDGAIDAADLEAFVHATETPCDPVKTAENRLISC